MYAVPRMRTALLTIGLLAASLGAQSTAIIPNRGDQDYSPIWRPGVPGGVDNPTGAGPATKHGATLTPSGGNDQSAIQAALDAAGAVASKASRRYVELGAGTFRIDARLQIPSYVILRGTMSGSTRQTILNQNFTGTLVALSGGAGSSWRPVYRTLGKQFRGQTYLSMPTGTVHNFAAGDIICIDHENEGTQWGPSTGLFEYERAVRHDKFIAYVSSLWYCRSDYAEGRGVESFFPDTTNPGEYRHVSQRLEVDYVDAVASRIYLNGTLHTDFLWRPEVYHAGGTGDVVRYAGLEDMKLHPSGTNGQRVVIFQQAFCSWVKNIEIDGSANTWSGRHIQLLGQTLRCEIRDSYFHESSNYNQGANAYGIVISGTDNLIENNIAIDLNKPIVCENSNGGNVIAYNYVDNAVIGSLTNDWQEAAISTHASFCYTDLFEGNLTPNITIDSTHGNNGWEFIFRNHCFGRNSNGHATTYERGIAVDGWNWWVYSIGNVLWNDGDDIELESAVLWTPSAGYSPVWMGPEFCYLLGSNAWDIAAQIKKGADHPDNGMAADNFYRHMDFEYETSSLYQDPANPVTTLPDSFYLASKPAFFGSMTWPWVVPTASTPATRVLTLPAKARYDAGNP